MIVYRNGDIVEAFKNNEIDVLVHGVNCQGKMNSGIAKQIRAEYPKVFTEYSFFVTAANGFRDCEEHIDESKLLGKNQLVKIKQSYIINAFTQSNYGYNGNKFCSYDAIDSCMKALLITTNDCVVGMPKIGAGVGGGDWKVIEAIINSHFHNRDIFVYTLEEPSKRSGKNDNA